MTERDLAGIFEAAAVEATTDLRPPGVPDLRRRLSRRRRRRTIGGILATVAVLATISVPVLFLGTRPAGPLRSVPPAVAPGTTAYDAGPDAVRSPGTVPAPRPTSSPATASSDAVFGRGLGGRPRAQQSSPCRPDQWAFDDGPADTIRFDANASPAYAICPGESIQVFWAQYVYSVDGSQRLYVSHLAVLTYAKPTDSSPYPEVPGSQCRGDLYWVVGDMVVVTRIPAHQHDPYPAFRPGKGGAVRSTKTIPCR